MKATITKTRHPTFLENIQDWRKWRSAYEGGRGFINSYLEKFSVRERNDDFQSRKKITYCPRFAGAAIDDIKNSIYQRMADISRTGGDKTYKDAIVGVKGGVDREGSTMDRFIGQFVLPEMLICSKVGIYVDMPALEGVTLYDNKDLAPYLYYYTAEEIGSWCGSYASGEYNLTSLMLIDSEEDVDPESGLVKGTHSVYRLYNLTPEGVQVTFYNNKSEVTGLEIIPGLTKIPFVVAEIPKSLMEDIADLQIALLNLHSSDISYILKSNIPLYVEQYDPRVGNSFAKKDVDGIDDPNLRRTEAVLGSSQGRQYPIGAHAPQFIHPSPEPLKVSMEKEQQIKDDIRLLLNLTLSSTEPKFASADSKGMDQRSLESGLSAIGLILQHCENQIARIWAEYVRSEPAKVQYPRSYSLKTEAERREEADADSKLLPIIPSATFQKAVAKKIAKTTIGHIVSNQTLVTINNEIDKAKYITSDPEAIAKDLENGLVSDATASLARGYDPSEVEQAKKDRAERIAITQSAQSAGGLTNPAARGVNDLNPVKGNAGAVQEKVANGAAGK